MTTTVWHNGKVWINENETSDAIAASDGVIVAHGADALALQADEKIDLKGATLLPGFGDGHAHPVFGGTETLFAPVRGPEKLEQLLEAIKTWADENPDAPWVRGEGYDPSLAPRGEFDAAWLDEIVPDRPVVLRAMDYHTAWVNTKALELAGITPETPQPLDGEIVLRTTHWQGRKVFFSLDTPAPGEIGVVEELLVDRAFVADPQEAAMISELIEVTPTVPHNVSNALAAAALARTVGVSHEAIRSAITEFIPGRHRIEKVLELNGVTWINDSKATNPHAASAAIMSALSVIWIAGGLAKGAQMGDLVERIKTRVRLAILIGEDRELIATELSAHAPHIEVIRVDAPIGYSKGGDSNALMESVIRTAHEHAKSGDTVLLAPACASMDQFNSYGDRGDRFRAAVEKVVRDGK